MVELVKHLGQLAVMVLHTMTLINYHVLPANLESQEDTSHIMYHHNYINTTTHAICHTQYKDWIFNHPDSNLHQNDQLNTGCNAILIAICTTKYRMSCHYSSTVFHVSNKASHKLQSCNSTVVVEKCQCSHTQSTPTHEEWNLVSCSYKTPTSFQKSIPWPEWLCPS